MTFIQYIPKVGVRKSYKGLKINRWGVFVFPTEMSSDKNFASIFIDSDEGAYKIVFAENAGTFKISRGSRKCSISFHSAMRHANLEKGKDYLIEKYSIEDDGSIIFNFSDIKG